MRLTAVRRTHRRTSTEDRSGRAGPRRHRLASLAAAAALAAAALVSVAPRVGAATEVGDAGDVPATAQVIATAETQIDGSLGANDIDLYKFCVDGGAFSAEVMSYDGYDSMLWLFGSNGLHIEYDDDDGVDALSLLEFADLPAGTYYLAMTDYWSEPNNSDSEAPTETLTSWPYTGSGIDTGAYLIAVDGMSAAPCTVPPVNTTDLYAVGYATGGPSMGAPSNLYSVDPNTGATTLIGPIEVDGTQLDGITGIDFGLDGLLYAVDNANQRLLTLDTATGAATVVGPYGSEEGWMSDVAFDAYGYLYGWDQGSADLARIHADGTTQWVGPAEIGPWGTGLAVDASNDMYVKDGAGTVYGFSPQTGQPVGDPTATFGYLWGETNNPAEFDADDVLYTVIRPESLGYTGVGSVLETLDPATGLVLAVGHEPDVMITGLAFDNGITTPLGDSTQLDVTLALPAAPVAFGDGVDVTVTVRNDGPMAAFVAVTVPLPAGLTYATHSAGATYDATSGVWSVGTLGIGDSDAFTVTATATGVGTALVTAAASADIYAPGPTTELGAVIVYATRPGTPADVAVSAGDGRAELSWTAPSNGGSGITGYRIYRCTGAACTAGTGDYTTATASPVTVTGLTNGTLYGFAVQAVNAEGAGTASATVYATPQFASATITSATKAQGKVTVAFTPTVPPLEVTLGTPLSYQVSGPKAGTWLSCTPLPSTTTCVVKTSAKTVAIRVSTDNGSTWGPASSAVTVTR